MDTKQKERYHRVDGERLCLHVNAYIERACCPFGAEDCGCKGLDSVACLNPECTGIEDHEIDGLFERLES